MLERLEEKLRRLDRSNIPAPLNYPIYLRLKKSPRNVFIRVLKSFFKSISKKDFEIVMNERIVEVPFLFQNFDLPKKARVLDFGCSESKVSIELASLGYDVVGIDLNDYPFGHSNFRFIKGNFLENKFHDGYFDAVVAISAVEHCGLPAYNAPEFTAGDKRIVFEFYRVLKRGGRLFITVPFGIRGLIEGPCGQRIYDADSLYSLLESFKILKEEYFIGMDRKQWLSVAKEELARVDSASKGFVQGVACIVGEKC